MPLDWNWSSLRNILCSLEFRGIISAATAAFFVEEGVRLGWATPNALGNSCKALMAYNTYDIITGGLSWKHAEHTAHHLGAVAGCAGILHFINTSSYEALQPMAYWLGLSEISTIFNGLRPAIGGDLIDILFASSFVIVRPIASAGAVRELVRGWGRRTPTQNIISLPLVSLFTCLNCWWTYKVVQKVKDKLNNEEKQSDADSESESM